MKRNKTTQSKKPPVKKSKDEKQKAEQLRVKYHKKELIDALTKCHGIISSACETVGLSRKTFYTYYKEDEKFKDEVDDVDEIVLDFSESKLHELIEEKEPSAVYFHLKCKGKKRGYIEKTMVDVEHKGLPQKMIIGGQEIDFS